MLKTYCIVENTKDLGNNPFALKSDNKLRARTNKHFKIFWRFQGEGRYKIIGAGKVAALLQEHTPTVRLGPAATADKHFEDAWNCGKDRHHVKVRETLELLFISK